MPRRKFIDKKNAINYRLVHRAQNDPRIHDADAPDMVFAEVEGKNTRDNSKPAGSSRASQYSSASRWTAATGRTGRSQIKSRGELENEFGSRVRTNEGEAASYGIYYDDSEYDYMQHMRDLNSGGGEAYFIEAKPDKKKGKQKMDLADALRAATLDDRQSEAGISVSSSISRAASDVFGEDLAPSEFVRKTTYQDQQNIPDAIAGFQPDMDPRLREVLEALEDEAYVEDEEDFFAELTGDPAEVGQYEWEEQDFEDEVGTMNRFLDEDDAGWESDDTIKASLPKPKKDKAPVEPIDPSTLPAPGEVPAAPEEGHMDYMEEFKKFKSDAKAGKAPKPAAPSDIQSSILTGASALTAGGRKKKRKGALTSTSNYSMTSSALHRTEGLTLLDQRFDKIEEEYAEDNFPDDASMISGMSGMSGLSKMSGMSGMSGMSNMSEVPQLRSDFDNIMDDFLGNHAAVGKRKNYIRKGKVMSGVEQLDEVRKGLGPARINGRPRPQNLKA
ncbi:Low temperature viability protein [Bimuria novae-zelandiae CBS 107.79]|uniref:Low temperature viability protein n=1 Tax=Bimuria novae-zelandiae CBS 107.79 TaxID=1447943 RepID=A0A6A5VDQ0_9PLEO|nr:Low temperature viability protein [Bimuria novae-zelandiae CBS 107.79]